MGSAEERNINKQLKFLQLHFTPEDNMYSFINLGCRQRGYNYKFNPQTRKGRKQKKGIYSCGYVKTNTIEEIIYNKNNNSNKVVNLINSFNSYLDHYITANGYSNAKERNSKTLFTLHNIVVDIDCHSKAPEKEFDMAMSSLTYFLEELFYEPDFPTPNTIVKTGRGVQIWWAINPVSAKAKGVYDSVRKYIIGRINYLLDNIPTLEVFKLDKAASKNYVGYYRFPGSYNSAVNKFGSFDIINNERLDVFEFCNEKELLTNNINNKCIKIKKNTANTYATINNIDTYREKMLYRLLDLRNSDMEGCRDLMCLVLCNAYLSSGRSKEETMEAVHRLNSSFNMPLRKRELEAYMSSSLNKKYFFTNAKIIELLGISKAEQRALGFYAAKDSKKQREEKRLAKKERNELIIKLFESGKTQMEISEEVGCSQPTVCRVIAKAELNESVEVVKETVNRTVVVAKEVINKIKNKAVKVVDVCNKHIQHLLSYKKIMIRNNVKVINFEFLKKRRKRGYIF